MRLWHRSSRHAPRPAVLFLLIAALAAPAPAALAEANSKYSSIIINAYTGKVLFSRDADEQRYPASLTKVMTLYLLFEALDKGEVTLKTQMTASARAAGQAPSKLGLNAGDKITVEDAIKAIVVKSANDVAVVIGEQLGGTESKFAQMMTNRARELGLTKTRFANASGLPNNNQYSTAREMAELARHVAYDYPQYYRYFAITEFTWKGRLHKTHNEVLKSFPGADGMKTGYIRASGFNLITSVRRDGYHLIGVVFGGRSTPSRDAHMKQILTEQFTRIAADPTLGQRYAVVPLPRSKPGTTAYVAMAPRDIADTLMSSPSAGLYTSVDMVAQGDTSYAGDELSIGSADLAPQDKRPDPIGNLIDGDVAQPMPAIAMAMPNADKPAPAAQQSSMLGVSVLTANGSDAVAIEGKLRDSQSYYGIQIGAYGIEDVARQRLVAAVERAPELLHDVILAVVPIAVDDRTVYRARIGPYREAEATAACQDLIQKGITCFTVVQEDWISAGSN